MTLEVGSFEDSHTGSALSNQSKRGKSSGIALASSFFDGDGLSALGFSMSLNPTLGGLSTWKIGIPLYWTTEAASEAADLQQVTWNTQRMR